MKFLFVFVAIFAVALAAPNADSEAVILKYENDNIGVDGYNYAVETSNGISQYEQSDGSTVKGGYAFTDPDGQVHEVTYVADENGFQPAGSDIPL